MALTSETLAIREGTPSDMPARRLHHALRSHNFYDVEVRGLSSVVVLELDVADANRLAQLLDDADDPTAKAAA